MEGNTKIERKGRPVPIYDYECKSCRVQHEVLHSMSSEVAQLCPACGSIMSKMLQAPSGIGIDHKHDTYGIAGFKPDKIPSTRVYTHRSRDGTK